MVEAFLKLDIGEIDRAISVIESRTKELMHKIEIQIESLNKRVDALDGRIVKTYNELQIFNTNLKKVDILKVEFTQESWQRNMALLDEMLAKMQQQTDLFMLQREALPNVKKEISGLTAVLYEVDKLVRSKAIQELSKGLKQ